MFYVIVFMVAMIAAGIGGFLGGIAGEMYLERKHRQEQAETLYVGR